MAGDEREEERRFLADLEARTGRDLAAWMTAIAAQGFVDKNQTIDWLRAQGIPFARASWLERIHANGGKPIYMDAPPRPAEAKPADMPAPAPKPLRAAEQARLEQLIAAAKGYRPLYHLLESELRKALPGVSLAPKGSCISIAAPREFAALTLHASELRLGLDLGERPHDADLQPARLKGAGPGITHMVVLTDARQVNADLIRLIKAAHARVNG
jgi:hypothetical protein